MSYIPQDEELNDADFAALFSADNNQPPKELDKLILDNALLSQHDSLPQQHETFTKKYAPLFGTAAILMIALTLTPLIMKAPETPDLAVGPEPTQTQTAESALVIADRQASVPESTKEASAPDSVQLPADQQTPLVSANDESQSNRIALAAPESESQASNAPEPISRTRKLSQSTETASNANLSTSTNAEADSVSAASIATDTAETNTVTTVSNTTDTIDEDNVAASPREIDTDALGINSDENTARVTGETESTVVSPAINDNKEEFAVEKAEATTGSNIDPADTQNDEQADLSAQRMALTEAAEIVSAPNAQIGAENRVTEKSSIAVESNSLDFKEIRSTSNGGRANTNRQNDAEELQENASLPDFELEISGLAPNTLDADKSEELEPAPNQDARLRTDQNTRRPDRPARVKAKNYRRSALLWVIEIKHMYNEQYTDQAKEELKLFRNKFPDNKNERLLPKKLLDSLPE